MATTHYVALGHFCSCNGQTRLETNYSRRVVSEVYKPRTPALETISHPHQNQPHTLTLTLTNHKSLTLFGSKSNTSRICNFLSSCHSLLPLLRLPFSPEKSHALPQKALCVVSLITAASKISPSLHAIALLDVRVSSKSLVFRSMPYVLLMLFMVLQSRTRYDANLNVLQWIGVSI